MDSRFELLFAGPMGGRETVKEKTKEQSLKLGPRGGMGLKC